MIVYVEGSSQGNSHQAGDVLKTPYLPSSISIEVLIADDDSCQKCNRCRRRDSERVFVCERMMLTFLVHCPFDASIFYGGSSGLLHDCYSLLNRSCKKEKCCTLLMI